MDAAYSLNSEQQKTLASFRRLDAKHFQLIPQRWTDGSFNIVRFMKGLGGKKTTVLKKSARDTRPQYVFSIPDRLTLMAHGYFVMTSNRAACYGT